MNVVFDLGGVVVRYDRAALMAELYADPAVHAAVHAGIEQHLDWPGMDRGTVHETEAVARAARQCGVPAHELGRFMDRMAVAWTPIDETVDLLYRLRAKGHALFCLSNMHPPSIRYMDDTFTFWDVFTGRVISCHVGFCKPEPEIYAHLLERFGLAAPETVFIDDMPVNLTAAATFGIGTIRFETPSQCVADLRRLGIE